MEKRISTIYRINKLNRMIDSFNTIDYRINKSIYTQFFEETHKHIWHLTNEEQVRIYEEWMNNTPIDQINYYQYLKSVLSTLETVIIEIDQSIQEI